MELIKLPATDQLPILSSNSPIQQAIRANGFKKLGRCTPEEMRVVLRYSMVLLGMTEKDALDQLEEDVMMDFLREDYGERFTSEDMRLAFRWAMSGKTDVDKSFYGKRFSVAYLSNFMEAYDVKKKELIELDRRNRKPDLKVIEDARTVEQRLHDRFMIFEKFVLENNKIPPMLDIIPCFNHLEMNGKLNLSKENIDAMQKQAEEEMDREIKTAEIKIKDAWIVRSLVKDRQDIEQVNLRTKRKFVEYYFKSLIS